MLKSFYTGKKGTQKNNPKPYKTETFSNKEKHMGT